MTPSAPRSVRQRVLRHGSARRRPIARRLAVPMFLLLGALVLGGCQVPTFGAYRGATTQGHDEFKLWSGMAIAGLVVAVLVWGLIFWAIAAYRRKDDSIPKQFHENIPIEIIYTIIPFILIAGIFYYTVVIENQVDAVSTTPAEIVHVVAYRWGWSFSYADGTGASQNVLIQTAGEPKLLAQPDTSSDYPQLVLPQGETVRIVLTAEDVIHGFYIPAFNFSRYAQPGVTNTFDFTPTTPGVYRGQCSQYCGLYHSEMIFSVKVVPPADFSQWLASSHT